MIDFFHDYRTFLLFLLFICMIKGLPCIHDEFSKNHSHSRVFLNDLTGGRLLKESQQGKIFADYSQVLVGGQTQINTIKRIVNISAFYFYNVITVERLTKLYFPQDSPLNCNVLKVPQQYQRIGVRADLGVICGNQKISESIYTARSNACVHLQSNKRPIWGMIMFNNNFLKFDQEGFQQILFVGMHQLTHILGFSAVMYELYPNGNPLVRNQKNLSFLNSSYIQQQINSYFECDHYLGLPLQDQDGFQVSSHWQRKVLGNQYMIAINKKNSYVSRFTFALLKSTGWYISINDSYSQPMVWGKGKGCDFLSIDDCNSEQFCTEKKFKCEHDGTGIGRCDPDALAGSCKIPRYFVNTMCVDQNYEFKNLNSNLNAMQKGGYLSRCVQSNFRQEGMNENSLNSRCYNLVCSYAGKGIYILVGSYILVCRNQGQIITAPIGLIGSLTCPRNFKHYCQGKKTCPYHCNKNGACINGKCQCIGQIKLSSSCADVSILKAPVGVVGNTIISTRKSISFDDFKQQEQQNQILPKLITASSKQKNSQNTQIKQLKVYSLDSKCMQGYGFDSFYGECLPCLLLYNCQSCQDNGCITCDDGRAPVLGRC